LNSIAVQLGLKAELSVERQRSGVVWAHGQVNFAGTQAVRRLEELLIQPTSEALSLC
jgi:hypothetical protein